MSGAGVETRMNILRGSAEQQILKPLQTHGWSARISTEREDGEYLVVAAEKNGATRSVALLYSSATDNRHYKDLDGSVDHIFTNGALYKIESFAYGISTPVAPVDEFFALLVSWNKALSPAETQPATPKPIQRRQRVITAENPLDAIWMRLKQFSSAQTAEKLIRRRAEKEAVSLSDEAILSKAAGIAFTVRNAADYLREARPRGLNSRIVSLYYGALALASAEMLAAPKGPSDLDEVEGFTKFGHGLYTVSGRGNLGSLLVGPLATGFFPRWASFAGCDVTRFPRAKAKSESDIEKLDGVVTTAGELFGAIPELADLYEEVFDAAPSWVTPHYDRDANPSHFSRGSSKRTAAGCSYIKFTDFSGRISLDMLRSSPWPLAEIEEIEPETDRSGRTFRARVDHPGYEYWFEPLPLHRSPLLQANSLILPQFGVISDYRAIAFVLLYALSIVVRYMPSTWRRVDGGDWDQYLPLVEMAVDVFERVLPEEFLQSISGDTLYTRQPGSFM